MMWSTATRPSGGASWKNAKPIVMHVMDTLAASRDVEDPKVKSEMAAQVLPLINDVPSAIERDTYRQRLARLLRVDERALMDAAVGAGAQPYRRAAPAGQAGAATGRRQYLTGIAPANMPGSACPGGAAAPPRSALQGRPQIAGRWSEPPFAGRFQSADHQTILRLLQESVDQDIAEPLNYVLNSLSLP